MSGTPESRRPQVRGITSETMRRRRAGPIQNNRNDLYCLRLIYPGKVFRDITNHASSCLLSPFGTVSWRLTLLLSQWWLPKERGRSRPSLSLKFSIRPKMLKMVPPLRNQIDWKTTTRTLTCLQQKDTASNARVCSRLC